jgi:hypothetical protein
MLKFSGMGLAAVCFCVACSASDAPPAGQNSGGGASTAGAANTGGSGGGAAGAQGSAGAPGGGAPVGGAGGAAAQKGWWCTKDSFNCSCLYFELPEGSVSADCGPLIRSLIEPCCIAFDNLGGSYGCMCQELNEGTGSPVAPPPLYESCQHKAETSFVSDRQTVPPLVVDACPSNVPPSFE